MYTALFVYIVASYIIMLLISLLHYVKPGHRSFRDDWIPNIVILLLSPITIVLVVIIIFEELRDGKSIKNIFGLE